MGDNLLIFYMTLLQVVFNDFRNINDDNLINIPKDIYSENDVLLKTQDDDLIYLRIQENDDVDELRLILKFCCNLKDKYSCNVDLNVLCKPEVNVGLFKNLSSKEINLEIVNCNYLDGDNMLDILNDKLVNKEPFTSFDMLSTILLPFMGSYDANTFQLSVHKFLLNLEKCNY